MNFREELEGKVALITGGASGIGYAVAKGLCDDGVKVVIADVNAAGVEKACAELGCIGTAVDLSTQEGCKKLVDFAVEKYGRVDILGNIAGYQYVCPIKDFPEEKWVNMQNLMINAPFFLTKYCWPYMEANKFGRIINMGSIHAVICSLNKASYVAAKHALNGLTKGIALEGGRCGITSVIICPAYVETPLVTNQIADQARTLGIDPEKVVSDVMLEPAAVKRLLQPNEIADAFKFVCTNECISGSEFKIDCGWTAK